jgi:Periplasmic copper-binding protein (NosD)
MARQGQDGSKGLIAMCAVVFGVFAPSAAASTGTLYISADAVLEENQSGPIVIVADNVVLDCANHLVEGSGDGAGISFFGHRGVEVRNCRVSGFAVGYAISQSRGSTLVRNEAIGNIRDGVVVSDSSENLGPATAPTAMAAPASRCRAPRI